MMIKLSKIYCYIVTTKPKYSLIVQASGRSGVSLTCSEITSVFFLGVDSRIVEEDPQPNRGILKGQPVGGCKN